MCYLLYFLCYNVCYIVGKNIYIYIYLSVCTENVRGAKKNKFSSLRFLSFPLFRSLCKIFLSFFFLGYEKQKTNWQKNEQKEK